MLQRYPNRKFPPIQPEQQSSTYEDGCGCTDEDPYGCFQNEDAIGPKIGSATDFTGLIPSLPRSDSELEAYAEMYDYPGDVFKD